MTDEKVRVRARIRFLSTEEGGRTAPLHGGGSDPAPKFPPFIRSIYLHLNGSFPHTRIPNQTIRFRPTIAKVPTVSIAPAFADWIGADRCPKAEIGHLIWMMDARHQAPWLANI